MALRSLVVKMKALPRRVPGSGAFATAPKPEPKPKVDPWSKISAACADPTKYGSLKEMAQDIIPLMEQKRKLDWEEHLKCTRVENRNTLLIGFFAFGSMGYLASYFIPRTII